MDILLQTQRGVGIQRSAGSGISRAVTLWRGKASSRRIKGFQMMQCRGNWSVLSGGNSPRPGGPPGHLPGPQKEPKLQRLSFIAYSARLPSRELKGVKANGLARVSVLREFNYLSPGRVGFFLSFVALSPFGFH